MHLHFHCSCGAKLKCSVQSIGRTYPCPHCNSEIEVPYPPEAAVRKAMKSIPLAMPECSLFEYASLIAAIEEITQFNLRLCSLTSHTSLVAECFDDAIRVLRNVMVFIEHTNEDDERTGHSRPEPCLGPLSSQAAQSNFGGIGRRKSKLRQFDRWRNRGNQPRHRPEPHPLAVQALGLIEVLKLRLDAIGDQ